jgi:ferrous iron transport protein A
VNKERDKRKVGIVLAAHGAPPPDWMEKNRERWQKLQELKRRIVAELKNWPHTSQSDRYNFETEKLVSRIRQRGGYPITELGYNAFAHPTVEEAIERAIGQGAQRVIVMPTTFTPDNLETEVDIPDAVATSQKRHPEVEIVYADPPFDYDRQVELVLHKVHEYDEYDKDAPPSADQKEGKPTQLNALRPGDVGIVHDLTGGRGFMCRLAALGFTPGAKVRMIQNFGHGPLIVNIRDTRIALGRREASKVRVARLATGPSPN